MRPILQRVGGVGRLGLLLLFVGLLLAAWSTGVMRQEAGGEAEQECTCEEALLQNGWCEACDRGYVAYLEIRSKVLHDALDAHGHDLDPARIACETCQALIATGGFCEACRFGWVDGQAYMSRLTYHLALGSVDGPIRRSCEVCGEVRGETGWCETCGTGWTGNVVFEKRAGYDAAAFEFGRLRSAIETSERCENCAMALLVDGLCPLCRIIWDQGVPVGRQGE